MSKTYTLRKEKDYSRIHLKELKRNKTQEFKRRKDYFRGMIRNHNYEYYLD